MNKRIGLAGVALVLLLLAIRLVSGDRTVDGRALPSERETATRDPTRRAWQVLAASEGDAVPVVAIPGRVPEGTTVRLTLARGVDVTITAGPTP